MEIINWIIGLFFFRQWISYGSRSRFDIGLQYNDQRRKREGLSSFMKSGFIAIGLSTILVFHFFNWIGFSMITTLVIFISVLGGIIILVVKSRKFDRNESNTKYIASCIVLGAAILIIFSSLYYETRPTKIIINEGYQQ